MGGLWSVGPGLPEGADLIIGGRSFHITYHGDGKNDVVLEADVSGTATLNQLNNSTTAIISFDDQAGHSGSVNVYVSQFNVTYTPGSGTPITFNTFCIDLFHEIFVGQPFPVNVRNDLDAFFANGGRMADIFNQFGLDDLTYNAIQAAAVQIAEWDLSLNNHNPTFFVMDADGTYSSGDENVFSVNFNGNPDAPQIAALVDYYLSLETTAPGAWIETTDGGGQSLLIPQPQFGSQPVVTGATVTFTEGLPASPPVAVITEADATVQASDFQVTINWGDGSALDSNAQVVPNGSGGFDVIGTHLYAEEGQYPLTVTVTRGSQQADANGTAVVEDAPLTAQPTVPTFAAAPGSPQSTGSTPDSVASGDLNGDGNADLVVANFYGASLSIYLGDGSGGFTHLGDYQTGSGPNGIAIAPDGSYVAVGNYYDGTVSVFATQADGSLVLSQTVQADAGTANRTAQADVNDDGFLDLVVANLNANDVSVFLGNGDGTFQAGVNYAAGNGPIAVVTGDFNGDGLVDLVTANYNDSSISLLAGDGTGSFAAPVAAGSAPGSPFDLVSADFNLDGTPDLAAAGFYGQITVLLGQGDGTFTAASYNSGSNPTQLTADDFNNDGIPDIAVSNFGNTVGVLTGNGDGTFQAVVSIPASGDLNGIISGDFNNDGQADIAVVGQDNNTLQVFLNTTGLRADEYQPFSGLLASFQDANPGATTSDFSATIDWGDGTQSQVDSSAFSVNARGGFDLTAGHTYDEGGVYGISITILDEGGSTLFADNSIQVSDLPLTATGTTVQATEGQEFNGVIASLTDADPNATAAEYGALIDWGDGTFDEVGADAFSANNSGGFDLTAAHTYVEAGSYDVSVLLFDQGGSTATADTTADIADAPLTALPPPALFEAGPGSPLPTGSTPDSVASGDLNGDDNPDLIVANFYGQSLSVYLGDGTGGFSHLGDYQSGSGPNGIVIAPDGSYVAVGNYYDGTVSVFATQSDGSLVLSQTLAADAGTANRTDLVDVNEDGTLDLVVANLNANDVSVFLGTGGGQFAAGTNYAAGNGPIAVVAGDFTGNGHISLLTANYNDSTVTLLAGDGSGAFAAPVVVASAPGNPFDLVSADFNGDGTPDAAVASIYGQITVLLGNGDGTFQSASYNSGSYPTQLTAGDFNGDGFADIAVSNFGNTVGILLGVGDGTFQPVVSIPASGDLNGIIGGDFNNDGKIDLAVVGQDNNSLQVFLNQSLQAVAGQEFSGTIVSFLDGNPFATTDGFSATIDWGDGQVTQVGSEAFVANNQGGFDLVPSHSYDTAGTFTVSITIFDDGGSTLDAVNTIYVRMA